MMLNTCALRLDLDRAAATTLQNSDLLRGQDGLARQAVFFDTPDQALRKAGFAICILDAQGQRVQLLTTIVPGMSPQVESVVQGDLPNLDAPLQALLRLDADHLAPVFRIEVTRIDGKPDTDQIGLTLDCGQIIAADRHADFCEVAIKGPPGETGGSFAMARQLQAIAPMRLSLRTEAERGYLLLAKAPRAFKAVPVELHPDMTALAAFQQIAFACLRQYRLNEDLLLGADLPEAVHQARVALRRLRSAFSIFRGLILCDRLQQLRGELRWLANVLGKARDLDVLTDRATADLAIHDRLQAARDAAYLELRQTLQTARVRMLTLNLAEWLSTGDWLEAAQTRTVRDQPLHDFAGRILSRYRRKLRKDGHDLARLDDDARHEVRKDAKKLRYAVDFFDIYSGKKASRRRVQFVDALEKLQDRLGLLNDLATTPHLLDRLELAEHGDAAALLGHSKRKPLLRHAASAMNGMAEAGKFWA